MAMGVEGIEDQLSLLTKEVFKISKQVTKIGEKLKIDMDLNSDEEDEESDDFEDEDEESAQDVLGSDENEENESEDTESLEKGDDLLDVQESDKEISKEDAEESEGFSVEPVDKGKDPTDNSEEVAEDDSVDVPLVHKWKKLRQNTPADVPLETSEGVPPGELLGKFKQSTATPKPSSALKGKGMRVKHLARNSSRKKPIPTKHVG
ncbi:hypothetical protein LIER_35229 [Lithospermum erythrorhizon]|uniref:Uncharacterized protein n=1 Tax=Lithospermum erythrorhizon TaxID=34254 RepID=A0AAV3NM41_LITER